MFQQRKNKNTPKISFSLDFERIHDINHKRNTEEGKRPQTLHKFVSKYSILTSRNIQNRKQNSYEAYFQHETF